MIITSGIVTSEYGEPTVRLQEMATDNAVTAIFILWRMDHLSFVKFALYARALSRRGESSMIDSSWLFAVLFDPPFR